MQAKGEEDLATVREIAERPDVDFSKLVFVGCRHYDHNQNK